MRKAVIISLDAMFDADMAFYGQDSWLGEWMKEAAVCTQVKTIFPALTYPSHTTLITGCDPSEHGIGHNQPFQPGVEQIMRKWYWEAGDLCRQSLIDRVKAQGGKCAAVLWPITGKHPSLRWSFPEVMALPGENQVLKMLEYGTALWILSTEIRYGRKRVSTKEPHLSDYAILLAEDLIRRKKPDLTLVHLVDLDEHRHKHGVYSREAKEALRRNEQRVRQIWDAMQQTPGMEDALLIIVSDHGQADVSRTVHLGDTLRKAGLEGTALVQSNGMTAYLFPDAQGDEGTARAEAYLRAVGEEIGVSYVYSRKELDKLGCIPEPAFAVEAAKDVVFSDGLAQAKREKATHGFGPGHHAENCILAVRGRGIRPGMLPSMAMKDVAPTVAALMGVSMPEASGKDCSKKMFL